jgi:hypothetical protein
MIWQLYRWTWKVISPLFIGATPAGTLNRCRLYVPARALWGAVTADIARNKANTHTFPEYSEVGRKIETDFRFSYLYPAEQIGDRYLVWLPEYVSGRGFVWRREDSKDSKDSKADRCFKRNLLYTRPGTAIEPSSDSAHEGSLRETECIQPYWRKDDTVSFAPVFMVGYAFSRNDGIWKEIEAACRVLFVGGDTRYGLGQIQCMKIENSEKLFDCDVHSDFCNPVVKGKRILGHAHDQSGNGDLTGSRERLLSWDRQKGNQLTKIAGDDTLWAPGSCNQTSEHTWDIDEKGIWN